MNAVRSLRRKPREAAGVDAAAHERLASALDRIASATSVIRTREQDAERFVRHGDADKLIARVESEAARLEQLVQRLEIV